MLPRELIERLIPGTTTLFISHEEWPNERHKDARWRVVSKADMIEHGGEIIDNRRQNKAVIECCEDPSKREIICYEGILPVDLELLKKCDFQPPLYR